jgi:membrane fusion protein (multidrug efflux system)
VPDAIYQDDVSITAYLPEGVEPAATTRAPKSAGLRQKLFAGLFGAAMALGAGLYAYDILVLEKHVTTDNAYVGADVADVTPLVNGPVRQVLVSDTQFVKRGDVLVTLDDTDARIALARAEAELEQTRRRIEGLYATATQLNAQIAARIADQARAEAALAASQGDFARAKIDLSRRQALSGSGSVSAEEVSNARNAFVTAQANMRSAEASLELARANRNAAGGAERANSVLIAESNIDTNPDFLAAQATRDQARVDLDRTVIRAPIDGVVSRRDVQVGQSVEKGHTLLEIAPIQQAYVDANFKEVQLARVHAGQTVTLTSDLYGGGVVYHGHVAGFAGGTGEAFAMIPAQNATGNWIKVVQRLPVRIALDPGELAAHPLRVGLSMYADIDVGND